MKAPLLIEIGLEELPAIPLLKIVKKIESSWEEILKSHSLVSDFEFYYTPRRLVLIHEEILLKEPDSTEELFGPPLEIALKEGEPTPAALGFAKKCGVEFSELSRATQKGKEVLYFKKHSTGALLSELIEPMLKRWLEGMAFGKMMRWGSRKEEFIRPLRWLQVRLGEEILPVELYGVKSAGVTMLHRIASSEAVEVGSIKEYKSLLANGGVVLDQAQREQIINAQFDAIEAEHGVSIERDSQLLAEVVAITENPTALIGGFDKEFLELPNEVIIASMKEHQRYFAVYKENQLFNGFVVVSNALCDDFSKVVAGNERVLRPRLADALFFYRNDLKNGLSDEGLEKIQFIDGLGSLKDKIARERAIGAHLCTLYGNKEGVDGAMVDRAISLAKCDLLSEMVYEFTELQGLMGYYYANALGEESGVALAIKEQYMPVGDGADLPSSLNSAIVALSIKIDTLVGLFSVGQIPTGSRDPFALRRAVNGIIRTLRAYQIPLDIAALLDAIGGNYEQFERQKLFEFIFDRIYKAFDVNSSVVASVLATGEMDLLAISQKIEAVAAMVSSDDFDKLSSLFKRVANIVKDFDYDAMAPVESALFEHEAEGELWSAFELAQKSEASSYKEQLGSLLGLSGALERYFDNVLVNCEDSAKALNRQRLIATIYLAFRQIADIKEITL